MLRECVVVGEDQGLYGYECRCDGSFRGARAWSVFGRGWDLEIVWAKESYQIRGSLEGDICNIKRGRLSRLVFAGLQALSAWDAFGTESLPARKG